MRVVYFHRRGSQSVAHSPLLKLRSRFIYQDVGVCEKRKHKTLTVTRTRKENLTVWLIVKA